MERKSVWFEVYDPYMNGYCLSSDFKSRFETVDEAISVAEENHARNGRSYKVIRVVREEMDVVVVS